MPPTSKPPGATRAGRSRAPKLLHNYSTAECEHCGGLIPGERRVMPSGKVYFDPGKRLYCCEAHRQAAHRERAAKGLTASPEERETARLVREGERIAARLLKLARIQGALEHEELQLVKRAAEIARLTPRLREVI